MIDGANTATGELSMEVIEGNIPAELMERPQWVGWRVEMRNGKPTKVPMNPHTGERGSSMDPGTWATCEYALEQAHRHGWGLGFVFTKEDPYAGVDVDGCVDPATGDLSAGAKNIVDKLDSYTEVSPSGTGIKIFVKAKLPPKGRKKGNVEMYDSGRFFTVTGRRLGQRAEVREEQGRIDALHRQVFGEEKPAASKANGAHRPPTADQEQVRERLCRDAGRASLYAGNWQGKYASQSEADLALCSHLAFFSGGDAATMDAIFRGSGLMRPKWDQAARAGQTYGEGTIEKAIAGCSDFYRPPNGNGHARWQGHGGSDAPPGGDDDDQAERDAIREEHLDDDPTARRAVLVRMSDVAAERVRWLWKHRVAIGKLNLAIGDPSASKSYLALHACAQRSRGLPLFGDEGEPLPPSTSLYFGCEDGLADTIRPRLDRLGADSSMIYVPRGWKSDTAGGEITLSDVDVIRSAIRETGATLVVIDPLQAWLGSDIDMNRANQVRPILSRLALLAEAEAVAIWVIMHMRKAEAQTVLYRAMTSIDFVATARSVLLVARDPSDRERRVVAQAKPSLTAEVPSLAYRITDEGLVWEGEVEMSAEDLLAAPVKKGAPKLDDAKSFLMEMLADEWRLKDEVLSEGEQQGIKTRTIERAREKLGVKAIVVAGTNKVWWTLSDMPFTESGK